MADVWGLVGEGVKLVGRSDRVFRLKNPAIGET